MRFVVDSNVLFTFFWKNSIFNNLLSNKDLNFFSPRFAFKEINKYSLDIMERANLEKNIFVKLKKELNNKINFISMKEYFHFYKNVVLLVKDFERTDCEEILNDIDFLALAFKLKCSIWSNDGLLKKQNQINILNTKEIITLIDIK